MKQDSDTAMLLLGDYTKGRTAEVERTRGVVRRLLETLSLREEAIIRHRYGIGRRQKTLKEIADIERVSPTRIRQIEQVALRKLRHPTRLKILEEDYDL